MNNLMAKEL